MATKTAWIEIAISASKAMNAINRMDRAFGKLADTVSMAMIAITAMNAVRMAGEFEALSKKVDNVTAAFENFGDATLLDRLRVATKGLVSDLVLMQQAVKFQNFGLPVEQLATMLEFAQMRAAQSGQSIDYMVESIIVGLGRQSIKVLDNLQINVAEFNKLVGEGVSYTDALARLMKDEMANSAKVTASEYERLVVAIENAKNSVAGFSPLISVIARVFEKWARDIKTITDFIEWEKSNVKEVTTAVDDSTSAWDKYFEEISIGYAKIKGLMDGNTPQYEPRKEGYKSSGGQYGMELLTFQNVLGWKAVLNKWADEKEKERVEHLEAQKELNDKLIAEEERRVRAFEHILERERDFQEKIRIENMRQRWREEERMRKGGAPGITPMFMKDGKDPEDAAKFGTELDKFNQIAELSTKYIDDFTNGLSQALIYGENFGESMANAFRAMTAQLVAAIAKALILAAILKAFPAVEALLGASNAALSVGERIIGVLTGENTRLQYDRSTSNSGRFK